MFHLSDMKKAASKRGRLTGSGGVIACAWPLGSGGELAPRRADPLYGIEASLPLASGFLTDSPS